LLAERACRRVRRETKGVVASAKDRREVDLFGPEVGTALACTLILGIDPDCRVLKKESRSSFEEVSGFAEERQRERRWDSLVSRLPRRRKEAALRRVTAEGEIRVDRAGLVLLECEAVSALD